MASQYFGTRRSVNADDRIHAQGRGAAILPNGIAAAETLHALHSTGSKEMRSAKALGWAALIAATGKLRADGLAVLHPSLAPII